MGYSPLLLTMMMLVALHSFDSYLPNFHIFIAPSEHTYTRAHTRTVADALSVFVTLLVVLLYSCCFHIFCFLWCCYSSCGLVSSHTSGHAEC
jgi:multisubunit Na+/H+ antiporter MnhG subunit